MAAKGMDCRRSRSVLLSMPCAVRRERMQKRHESEGKRFTMMSTTRARRLLLVAPLAAACLVGAPAAAIAKPSGFDPAVIAQFQAEAPLDAVANAVGEQGRGAIALWIDSETVAHFRNLRVSP